MALSLIPIVIVENLEGKKEKRVTTDTSRLPALPLHPGLACIVYQSA